MCILYTHIKARIDKTQQNGQCRLCGDTDETINHRISKYSKLAQDLDLARESKKLWNMKVTIIPIVIGAFGTVTKGLLKGREDLEIKGRVETIETTTLLRTARILSPGDLRRLKKTCCHSNSSKNHQLTLI